MTTTRKMTDEFRFHSILIHDDEVMQFEGRLAVNIIERFALISCDASGEDSAGRQKLALMSPDAIVERACDIAQATGNALRHRQWLTQDISIEALLEDADKKAA